MKPYVSARHDYRGEAVAWLDANENPFPADLNRYPDPDQQILKQTIARLKGVDPAMIFIGNGSDEAIDLLMRACCTPGKDSILVLPPTYGMYRVSAAIQGIAVEEMPLRADFSMDEDAIAQTLRTGMIRMLFVCSPNNPTGTVMDPLAISRLAASFQGLVVVDEAYMDFHAGRENDSMLSRLMAHPNIVVLQTFSKGWGMAGARLGMAIGNSEIIAVLNQIKAPYNVNSLTARAVLTRLEQVDKVEAQIAELIRLRDALHQDLGRLTIVEHVYPSAANFLLVRFSEPARVHQSLLSRGIVVRDRSAAVAGCLRITVGTAQENKLLIDTLSKL